jgi:hypothetical protein
VTQVEEGDFASGFVVASVVLASVAGSAIVVGGAFALKQIFFPYFVPLDTAPVTVVWVGDFFPEKQQQFWSVLKDVWLQGYARVQRRKQKT